MIGRQVCSSLALASVLLLAVGGATGCAADAGGTDLTQTAVETTASQAVAPAAVSDQQSCQQFTDVLTILQNANADYYDGRMDERERDGWLRLATRVQDRIPTIGDSPVSEAIATLKEVAPAIQSGVIAPTTIGGEEWSSATQLADLCKAAGFEIFAEGFTGG